MAKQTTTIRLEEELLAGLQEIKARDGVPVSEQVRRAIQEWLKTKGVKRELVRGRAVRKGRV